MSVDLDTLAGMIIAKSPFTCAIGKDYIEIQGQDGLALDNVTLDGNTATWGNHNQYTYSSDDLRQIANAILITLKDAV